MHTTTIWGRAAALAALAIVVLLAAGCQKDGTAAGGNTAAAAAASSGKAAVGAYASSSAGAAAKTEAQQIANACKSVLGGQGFNAMAPLVPGAKDARKRFWDCEKIPRPKIAATVACLIKGYTSAPPKGADGSAEETRRQAYLTDAAGHCIATAKGITLQTAPPATPAATRASPSGSPS